MVLQIDSMLSPSCAQVDGEEVSRIGAGLLCLIGVRAEDSPKDADFMYVSISGRAMTNSLN